MIAFPGQTPLGKFRAETSYGVVLRLADGETWKQIEDGGEGGRSDANHVRSGHTPQS